MEFQLLFKIIIILSILVGFYVTVRNLDVIKIILNYWIEKLFRK